MNTVTHIKTLQDYCDNINIPQPLHNDFDIRSFAENMPTVVQSVPPFRHEFYAIAIRVDGEGQATTGATSTPEGPTIFFNSPFQIISWDIAPNWDGYYLMFTKAFMSQSTYFNNLLDDFPFLRVDKSIPLAINQDDLPLMTSIFSKIYNEYHADSPDKLQMIEVYVLLLLTYIRRYFGEQLSTEAISRELRNADIKLMSRYQTLIEMSLHRDVEIPMIVNIHSVQYYADQLSVHPNHLNAIVKSVSGQTALNVIHQHLIQLAKTYLLQTEMSVQEIAYQLHFESPNYFSRFFKKHTQSSPLKFRKQNRL